MGRETPCQLYCPTFQFPCFTCSSYELICSWFWKTPRQESGDHFTVVSTNSNCRPKIRAHSSCLTCKKCEKAKLIYVCLPDLCHSLCWRFWMGLWQLWLLWWQLWQLNGGRKECCHVNNWVNNYNSCKGKFRLYRGNYISPSIYKHFPQMLKGNFHKFNVPGT